MRDLTHPAHFFIGVIFIFVTFWFFVPIRFEENDDIVMMMLASGDYSGKNSANLVFINYYLANIFRVLYINLPWVDWYPGIFLLVHSCCFMLVLTIAMLRLQKEVTIGIFAFAALGSLLLSLSMHLQFTTVASVSVAVGAWTLLILRSRILYYISAILVIFGFLLRFEAAVLVVFVGSPFILLAICKRATGAKKVIGLCAIVLLGVILNLASDQAYATIDPDYVLFNDLRGKINDNPNAELAIEDLPDGISINDYALLHEFFIDPHEISLDNLMAIYTAVEKNEDLLTIQDWLQSSSSLFKRVDVLLILGILMLLATAALPKRMDAALLLIGGAAFFVPMVYIDVFATLKDRVFLGAVASLLTALFFLDLRLASKCMAFLVSLGLIGLTGSFLIETKRRLGETFYGGPIFSAQARMIEDWDGIIFAYKNHLHVEFAQLFTKDLEPLSKKVVFSGWMVLHPDNTFLDSHKSLLNNNVALFVSPRGDINSTLSRILLALRENYSINAAANIIDRTDVGVLYKFQEINDQ